MVISRFESNVTYASAEKVTGVCIDLDTALRILPVPALSVFPNVSSDAMLC